MTSTIFRSGWISVLCLCWLGCLPARSEDLTLREVEGNACELVLPVGGSFRLEGAAAGGYRIQVKEAGGSALRSEAAGKCAEAVKLERDSRGEDLHVLVSIRPGTLPSIEQLEGRLHLTFSPAAPVGAAGPSLGGNLSAGSDEGSYRVGPKDILTISVANYTLSTDTFEVGPDGRITFPWIGATDVVGLTTIEIAKKLEDLLNRDSLVDPDVSVAVKEYASQFVFVSGQVRRPGKFPLKGGTTLKDSLAEAGGLDSDAAEEVVLTRRRAAESTPEIFRFTLTQIEQDERSNPMLLPGDEVSVPAREFIFIQGEVQQPDRYPYESGMTLMRSITIAKGLKEWANRREIRLLRTKDGKAVRETYDLRDIEKLKIPDVPLQPGDIIIVPRRLL